MNRKQLTFLIVLGVVLCGLAWLAFQKEKHPYQESSAKLGARLLPDFPLNDVAQLTIKQPGGELNLAKKDDLWVVKERGDYPANFANISDFLRKFWELKVAKPVKAGPSRLPQLELVAPGQGNGTLVDFKDKSGKSIKSVLLGAKTMRDAGGESPMGMGMGMGGGSFPNGRYVMVGSDLQSIALVTEPFANAEAKPEEWLNKEWFKIERLKSLELVTTNATNNFKITRETESGEWKLAESKPGELLDSAKSTATTGALSFPTFNDIATNASPELTGMARPILATLETFDGFTYITKIGAKSGEDSQYLQVAVSGNFPKERTPGKDEKPEDKAKLDKEFQDNSRKLEERLKNEKAYEKWTYIVSKWTVEPLLKERKDLLAEKKEEPKKVEAPLALPDEKK